MKQLIAGTRGSALALWQTEHVIRATAQSLPKDELVSFETQVISTKGDVDLSEKLVGKLEKGFFTVELEEALRSSKIDFAVHSLKDLPTQMSPGLQLAAVLKRNWAHDVLVVRPSAYLERDERELPLRDGAIVGSSSLRREAALRTYAPFAQVRPLRGNVPTRIQKLKSGHYDAIVVAWAGLHRLNLDLSGLLSVELNPKCWVPAPGQGAIAVQCRQGDERVQQYFQSVHHQQTARHVSLERFYLACFEGGCTTPFGAYVEDETLHVGLLAHGAWRTTSLPAAYLPSRSSVDETFEGLHALSSIGVGREHPWLYRKF